MTNGEGPDLLEETLNEGKSAQVYWMNRPEKHMEHEDHGGKQNQLEEHSLPGTNQAGKGPGSSEENAQEGQESGPGDAGSQHQDQLEEHSLPGTNQAGKGPDRT